MRLRELRDVYLGQDIYIVGSGPTAKLFSLDFLRDKIVLGLNDAYKIDPAITPISFLHHQVYAHSGDTILAPYHDNFFNIKYPIVKRSGQDRSTGFSYDHPRSYVFDWSHEIDNLSKITKETDILYYTPEGCSLHAALQVCWIMGAKNIFVIGCDSRTFGEKHYADYDKNGFRADETLKRGAQRNYNSYIYGALLVGEFLQKKGIRVMSLSPMFGYALLDYQYDFFSGAISGEQVMSDLKQDLEAGKQKVGQGSVF